MVFVVVVGVWVWAAGRYQLVVDRWFGVLWGSWLLVIAFVVGVVFRVFLQLLCK